MHPIIFQNGFTKANRKCKKNQCSQAQVNHKDPYTKYAIIGLSRNGGHVERMAAIMRIAWFFIKVTLREYLCRIWCLYHILNDSLTYLLCYAWRYQLYSSHCFVTADINAYQLPFEQHPLPTLFDDTSRLIFSLATLPSTNCYHPRLRFELLF